MTKLYFKNNKVLPKHKINDMEGWKELEYNIPTYDKETYRIKKYNFEELETKVIAHAEIIWVYEARFILPDETVYETFYITYGDTLGSEFILIDKDGVNQPTYESREFKGWYSSSTGGTKLTSSYVINQNVLEDGYIVEFNAQFLDTRGLVFTYNTTDDVYDITDFILNDNSVTNGSLNLHVPATFDNGTNGERYVRNVKLYSMFNSPDRSKLGSIVIEENILTNRQLPNDAFRGFTFLKQIEIPYGFNSIGNYAFDGCSALTSIDIPESVTSMGGYAFSGCSSLTSVTIPEGVTSINERAFQNCSSLTSITLPSSVTSIGTRAFNLCTSLTSINIPEGVTYIGTSTFQSCSALTLITIPTSVRTIYDSAFTGCSKLIAVYLLQTTPPTLSNTNAFSRNGSGRTFYIPKNTYTAYSTATNWIDYASDMEEVI